MNVKFTSMLTGQMQDMLLCIVLVELACNMQHATCNHDWLQQALEIKMDYMYCILIIHAVISNNFLLHYKNDSF